MTIVEFIRARLADDERVARAATPSPWGFIHAYRDNWTPHEPTRGQPAPFILGDGTDAYTTSADAAHIARHDPARVLREVEAKRRLVDLHAPMGPDWHQTCPVCWDGAEAGDAFPSPCPTLRLLAMPYQDHPDYDPTWSPA